MRRLETMHDKGIAYACTIIRTNLFDIICYSKEFCAVFVLSRVFSVSFVLYFIDSFVSSNPVQLISTQKQTLFQNCLVS